MLTLLNLATAAGSASHAAGAAMTELAGTTPSHKLSNMAATSDSTNDDNLFRLRCRRKYRVIAAAWSCKFLLMARRLLL